MTDPAIWPTVDVSAWAATKRSLHLYLQMLGKIRVALAPAQPNWMFTALQLNARGLTTGPMPCEGGSVEALIDVFNSEILVQRSNGYLQRIPLLPARPVAEVYSSLRSALAELQVPCTVSVIPQELSDRTPLSEDDRPAQYEPEAVQRWFTASTMAASIFDQWREHFFGRSGIQVWWGALDVTLLLFSGKHVPPPTDRGYIMQYDLDAELFNAGLFFGDETTAPYFYGYIFPQPQHAEKLQMHPAGAAWSNTINEWVLPYETVRSAANPTAQITTFLNSLYEHCTTVAGWDRKALSYDLPKRKVA